MVRRGVPEVVAMKISGTKLAEFSTGTTSFPSPTWTKRPARSKRVRKSSRLQFGQKTGRNRPKCTNLGQFKNCARTYLTNLLWVS
jgi:hypothetical protein